MRFIGILALILIIGFFGIVSGDDPIPAVHQTAGITTVTSVVVYGTMTESDSIVWQSSNRDLRDNPPLDEFGLVSEDGNDGTTVGWTPERQYTLSYSEDTMADNGYIEYNKMVSLDTSNQQANQNNFKTTRQLDFVSFDDAFGSITTSESLLLDGASMGSSAGNGMNCPWGYSSSGIIPAYCNIIEMGSSFTGSQVSMVTTAGERHISASADIPVAMDYSVSLSGVGSAAAWIRAHLMEGRASGTMINYLYPFQGIIQKPEQFQSGDLMYSEKTTASGNIESFSKAMSYQSGVRRF